MEMKELDICPAACTSLPVKTPACDAGIDAGSDAGSDAGYPDAAQGPVCVAPPGSPLICLMSPSIGFTNPGVDPNVCADAGGGSAASCPDDNLAGCCTTPGEQMPPDIYIWAETCYYQSWIQSLTTAGPPPLTYDEVLSNIQSACATGGGIMPGGNPPNVAGWWTSLPWNPGDPKGQGQDAGQDSGSDAGHDAGVDAAAPPTCF
jgi:hypothetical protein